MASKPRDLKKETARLLRKRDHKTAAALAKELGVSFQRLAGPIGELVRDGAATRHAPARRGDPPTYTKA